MTDDRERTLSGPREIKWSRPHVDGCAAVRYVTEGTWDSPWYCVDGEIVYLDALGRNQKGAHRRWLVFRCNLTTCDAELLVKEDALLAFLPNGHGDWE